MKTLQQIAEKLNVPATSLRYHARSYKEFLPSKTIEGTRWEQYEDEAEEILKRIMKSVKQGNNRATIKEELEKEYSPIYDAEQEEKQEAGEQSRQLQPLGDHAPTTTNLQQVQTLLNQFEKTTQSAIRSLNYKDELLQQKEKEIEELRERARKAEEENNTLTRETQELKEELEKTQKPKRFLGIFN